MTWERNRFRTPDVAPPLTERQQKVRLANERVRVEWVLRDLYNIYVPEGATAWRTSCPWGQEHSDGGIGRTFRVYAESNSAHCFASHGTQSPVRLWALANQESYSDAAESMLRYYQVGPSKESYRARHERRRREWSEPDPPMDVEYILFHLLPTHPGYLRHQFDPDVMELVVAWTEAPFPLDTDEFKEKFSVWKERLWALLDSK